MSARKVKTKAGGAVGVGRGADLEIELASGRLFEISIKTADGHWGNRGEFKEALKIARKLVVQPVEE